MSPSEPADLGDPWPVTHEFLRPGYPCDGSVTCHGRIPARPEYHRPAALVYQCAACRAWIGIDPGAGQWLYQFPHDQIPRGFFR